MDELFAKQPTVASTELQARIAPNVLPLLLGVRDLIIQYPYCRGCRETALEHLDQVEHANYLAHWTPSLGWTQAVLKRAINPNNQGATAGIPRLRVVMANPPKEVIARTIMTDVGRQCTRFGCPSASLMTAAKLQAAFNKITEAPLHPTTVWLRSNKE